MTTTPFNPKDLQGSYQHSDLDIVAGCVVLMFHSRELNPQFLASIHGLSTVAAIRAIRQNCEIAKVELRIQSCVTSRVKYISAVISRILQCYFSYAPFAIQSVLKEVAEQTDRDASNLSSQVGHSYSIQVAQTLMFLHTSEPPTVHLDVKPSNILVGK